jgi:hypothetical protein
VSPRAHPARPPGAHLALLDPSATPEEAAAIVAALERFMRATGRGAAPTGPDMPGGWRVAGLLEGVGQDLQADSRHPWINT